MLITAMKAGLTGNGLAIAVKLVGVNYKNYPTRIFGRLKYVICMG